MPHAQSQVRPRQAGQGRGCGGRTGAAEALNRGSAQLSVPSGTAGLREASARPRWKTAARQVCAGIFDFTFPWRRGGSSFLRGARIFWRGCGPGLSKRIA
eukprot:5198985-Lingulodinium_polyedra.AAC.1